MPVINPLEPTVGIPPAEGPCSWPVDTTCVADWATFSPDVQAAAVEWSTYVLWALTGRRYGPCQVTVRPCGPRCDGPGGYLTFPVTSGSTTSAGMPWMIPWIDNGVWRNCGCGGGCACSATCEVALQGPVAEILEVTVDGAVVPSTAYRLDYVKTIPVLVRIDDGCWPDCQDLDVGLDEVGSFGITYSKGIPVPRAGQLAAGQLAGEFAKACRGSDCQLPQQLASLTRNGIDVQVVDPTQFLENGLTGIANVDLWIRAVNPLRKAQRSRVYSPDMRPVRQVTS